ncbi:hypothetical protein ACFC1D_29090, partial [Streptomyces vinaceus]|uniref:hypothetical protein n=1 Tax=Streptomyces vinaceus TaxID=1960 RepID=UPI0035DDE021
LALIFGTLLSSQGTDASFVLTLSGFPPGFRSCVSDSIRVSSACFPGTSLSRFPFPAMRLYQKFSTGFPGFGFLDEESIVPRLEFNSCWGRERL